MELHCYDLRCDSLASPLGLDSASPSFSWKLRGDRRGIRQARYRLRVARDEASLLEGRDLAWDSGVVDSGESLHRPYSGDALESRTRYAWDVVAWDTAGARGSAASAFETAFMGGEGWKASWIEPPQEPAYTEPFMRLSGFKDRLADLDSVRMRPAQMLRKDFALDKPIRRARAYATAHGVYFLELNGRRVGDMRLSPGYTSYDRYLEYQTYDVTSLLAPGGNAVGVVVGDGWYCGKVGMPGGSCPFGDRTAVLFQLEIDYEGGGGLTLCSDDSWLCAEGPIRYSDLFVGEKYDAAMERPGFSRFGYESRDLRSAVVRDYGYANLRAQCEEPVRAIEELKPAAIWVSPRGETILDVGQVIAGHLRMRVRGARGEKILLEHAETIDEDGNFLFNVQGVFTHQTDTYVMKGEGEEFFEPSFTYHGFRYVRISGYPGAPTIGDFDAIVIGSDLETTGSFSCSDERLSKLQRNIVWSQRGNMVSVPTDCPQREKQGWTGDAQVFAPTACFNMGMASFLRTWLRNMRMDQLPDGQVPNVVPYIKAYSPGYFSVLDTHCSAGWGDAAVIVPWVLYRAYGDAAVLEENYDMMRNWVAYIQRTAETESPEGIEGAASPERRERMRYLWNTNYHMGDWLTPSLSFDYDTGDVDMRRSAQATKEVVPTCFYAHSTDLLSRIAGVLGKADDAAYYRDLNGKIKEVFAAEYVDAEGNIKTGLQGIYVLALKMGLVPGELEEKAAGKLARMIRENGTRLDTGFLSVPFILDVLKDEGRLDLAFDLLFQDECPSWLYEVKMGATTIWESWQAVLPDGKNTTVSRNHYAFGCVGDWMYRVIGGISALKPGYRLISIAPELDSRIGWAKASLESAYGTIECCWRVDRGEMTMEVHIPANTAAEIRLPRAKVETVWEGGAELSHSECVTNVRQGTNCVRLSAGSGSYKFAYRVSRSGSG